MNVYDYAMKVEKEGEQYYKELANRSPYTSLKKVFNILANEEVKHYQIIRDMKNSADVNVNELDIILDTATIFDTLTNDKDNVDFDNDEIKFYEEAIEREDSAEKFYLEKACELEDPNDKAVFLKIAEEEAKHKVVLHNILDFIQEPKNFVESAEF